MIGKATLSALREAACRKAVESVGYVAQVRFFVLDAEEGRVCGGSWEWPCAVDWEPGVMVVDSATGMVWEAMGGDRTSGAREWVGANFSPWKRPRVRKTAGGAESAEGKR